jgi:hypothetical protein
VRFEDDLLWRAEGYSSRMLGDFKAWGFFESMGIRELRGLQVARGCGVLTIFQVSKAGTMNTT